MLLAEYNDEIIAQFAHPTKGIAADCKFFPNLAEMKEWLEKQAEDAWQYQRRMAPYRVTRADLDQIAGPVEPPKRQLGSLRSELLELYQIPDIPRGWDAVDLAHAKGRYRENFHDEIAKALDANLAPPRKPSLYDGMIAKAKAAMETRQAASRETP
jgi:hypothetical protein